MEFPSPVWSQRLPSRNRSKPNLQVREGGGPGTSKKPKEIELSCWSV